MTKSKKDKVEKVDPETLPKRIVFYTDGGCHQKIGVGGWGLHGYLFVDLEPNRGSGCPGHSPSIGGYVPNKDKSAKKVTILKYVDANGAITNDATNNIAELQACIKAHQIAATSGVVSAHFVLDSKYVLDGIEKWMENWKKNDWKRSDGSEVMNQHYWVELDNAIAALNEMGVELSYSWVKGHSGNPGNTRADTEATRGLVVAQKKQQHIHTQWSDPTGYWNIKAEYSRMFAASRHIFMSGEGETFKNQLGYYPYYLFDPPSGWEDDLFGLLDPDSCHCVIYMKERDEVIESVKRFQHRLSGHRHNTVAVARLDTIFKPKVYSDIDENADLYLYTNKRRGDILTVDRFPVTLELNPPKLAFVGVQGMERLEGILKLYIEKYLDENGEQKEPTDKDLILTDITPIIYEEKTSKKGTEIKIRKEFNTSIKHIDVDINVPYKGKVVQRKTRLIFGVDLPRRNVLAAVSPTNPKLQVVSWRETDSVYHVAIVLQTDEGLGIWTNVHTNFRFDPKTPG